MFRKISIFKEPNNLAYKIKYVWLYYLILSYIA